MAETLAKDIGLYKHRLSNILLDSAELCELFLGKNYNNDDVEELMHKQIFPYLYIDETQDEVLPFICFEVDIPVIPTGTIKDMQIIIWCYCHRGCMKYSRKGYLGTRADIMADMVERQLRNSDAFGIGELNLQSITYLNSLNSKYYGRQLIYTTSDFKLKG